MLNTVYRLVAPRRFEVAFQETELYVDALLVRPTHLSICHADQRYYQGLRPADILDQKLPMALIHEGIGKVVFDPQGQYQPGERVIMIPNTPMQDDPVIAENYRRSSLFRASGFDGFMQEHVQLAHDRVIRLPESVDETVAAFTELVSVSMHGISRFEQIAHQRRECIGVWGDGNLGYITSLLLRAVMPECRLIIFGTHAEKLSSFTFADETHMVINIPEKLHIDHAFECVGGDASQRAIAQIIDHINPEGTIALLGVSEYPVPINTRMILERGLRLFGSSRSGREDFIRTVEIFEQQPEIINYLSNIVGAQTNVCNISDMKQAFEMDIQKSMGKTIMQWNV